MFWFVLNSLMLIMDVAWWIMLWRLTRKKLWRIIGSAFLAAQTSAQILAVSTLDWAHYVAKPVLISVILWHYFVLIAGFALLLAFVCVRLAAGMARVMRRSKNLQARPIAASLDPDQLKRREFLGACVALAPPLFNLGLTSVSLWQLNQFRVRRFTLAIPTLPRALDGLTIAHVSDVHVGRLTDGRVLRQMVDTTNSLRPDLILVTGDLIHYALADLPEAISLLKAMDARYGLWMIEGNHDLFQNGGEFEQRVKASGLPLLLNESAVADVRGHPVQFFGLRWMDGHGRRHDEVTAQQVHTLMRHRQPEAFPVLLAHHPHAFDAAMGADLPLVFAGHTHGGQVMLDRQHGVGSVLFRYWSGLYTRANSNLIVSNGVGNMFPVRINAPAEIVHVTLRCADKAIS